MVFLIIAILAITALINYCLWLYTNDEIEDLPEHADLHYDGWTFEEYP